MSAYERLEDLKLQRAVVAAGLNHLLSTTAIESVEQMILREMALLRLIEAAEREHIKESEESERHTITTRELKHAQDSADMVETGYRKTLADRLAFLNGMGQNPTVEERAKIQRGEASSSDVLEARHREIESIRAELATV